MHQIIRKSINYVSMFKIKNKTIKIEVFYCKILMFPAALDPGVYSASNRNEYQKHKNNVSGE
jgi:hypothetical protein